MRPSRQSGVGQACPNCQRLHDVSVYVTGQKITCSCGIRFEVRRLDVGAVAPVAAVVAAPAVNNDSSMGPTIAPPSKQGPTPAEGVGATVAGHAGLKIPGYELVMLLGKGGMGEVWKARQVSLDRIVAVKLLPAKLARDPEFISRFEKEATALASLSHPNITQIIDRGVASEHYFFAMELVVGKTLREVMNEGRPQPSESLRIAAQIARAIDYAHEQKIVHRDLKPENILLDARGHVKVADFGLAGMRGSDKDLELTATAVAMGTVNYMAPEQRRDAKHVDHRADIYSLGVMLYELLTGELPMGRFKMPSEKVDGLDGRIDELIGSMLESDPMARPAHAQIPAEQLEAMISSPSAGSMVAKPVALTSPDGPRALTRAAAPSVVDRTWSGFKVGLMVLGTLALVGLSVKALSTGTISGDKPPDPQARSGPQWYTDSDGELYSDVANTDNGFTLSFAPSPPGASSGELLNVHCGSWKLDDGSLTAVQWGGPSDLDEHPRLVPRAYVGHRYYSADDFSAEVEMQLDDLSSEFPPLQGDAQRFGELAFRIKDLQVSLFALRGHGIHMQWRYFNDGAEISGTSDEDLAHMVEDETHVPTGRFKLRLKLTKGKAGAADVEAFVNGQRFVHKVLPGLAGQVGKVALGCKNLSCRFDDLKVSGKPAARPASKRGEQ
jgi:serine/threonine-protein kinase